MTSYHGGKIRHGKVIANTILNDIGQDSKFTTYCEPFCGMLGVYNHIVKGTEKNPLNYLAGDINQSIILMWKDAQKGWRPEENYTKEQYLQLKSSPPCATAGFVGHQFSYGGAFFHGYASQIAKKRGTVKSRQRIDDYAKLCKNVNFSQGSFEQFSDLTNSIIYCDPPYVDSYCRYSDGEKSLKFDQNLFIEWCEKMTRKGNVVYMSNYGCKSTNVEILWSCYKKIECNLTNNSIYRTEILYKFLPAS